MVATSAGLGAGTQLTIADTGGTASRLTAEMSAQALTAQGFTVTRTSVASVQAADAALAAGTIDAYATDTATVLERVLARPKLRDDPALIAELTSRLATRGQVPLGVSVSDDAPQVACRRAAVKTHKLSGLLTLGRAAGNLTYAATASHVVRADGLASLRVRFKRVVVSPDTKRFDVIARRKAHCVLSSGAEPRAVRLGLVSLRDRTRRLAGTPVHAVLVASQVYVTGAPATLTPTLARVAGATTTDNLATLMGQVELDATDVTAASQAFLRANGIIA